MTIQLQKKKKQLIKTSLLNLMAVGLAGGLYFGISYYEDSSTEERNSAQSKFNEITSTTSALKDRLSKSNESYAAYEKILRYNQTADFTLNRKIVAKLLEDLKAQFPVSNLQVNISPVKEVTTDVGKKKTGKVIYSEVKVEFGTPSDTIALQFTRALSEEFPGLVLYQSVSMKKIGELTTSAFQQLANNRLPTLVSVELNFNWYGLKPNETSSQSGAPQ